MAKGISAAAVPALSLARPTQSAGPVRMSSEHGTGSFVGPVIYYNYFEGTGVERLPAKRTKAAIQQGGPPAGGDDHRNRHSHHEPL